MMFIAVFSFTDFAVKELDYEFRLRQKTRVSARGPDTAVYMRVLSFRPQFLLQP